MTTNATPYQAPDGFIKGYTFDANGNIFGDGKQLSGVSFDINQLKPPAPQKPATSTWGGLLPAQAPKNPYAQGGNISRLSVDDNGNLFAVIDSPRDTQALGSGHMSMAGYVNEQGQPINTGPSNKLIPLTGVSLDPARTSKAAGGSIGTTNNAYLRQEQDGLYFAQVNKGSDIAAYAYSAFQPAKSPTGGPAQVSTSRKQGGNAGGGAGPSASTGVSLLGS